MADQTSGESAPQSYETKNMPGGFDVSRPDPNVARPAPVPYTDTTHLDREASERDQEVGSAQGDVPTGTTETGGKTGTRKSGTQKSG